MTLPTLTGPTFGPAAGGRPSALVVMLHGLGADGRDLIALAPMLARTLPRALFVSPDAPFPCDMAPYGRQWFSLQDRAPAKLLEGMRLAQPIVDGFLDGTLGALGLDGGALALLGFSQGAMTSLYTGLRRAVPPAAILAFSGALVGEVPPRSESAMGGGEYAPVLLVHGEDDPVVPFASFRHARAALVDAGVPVEAVARPGLGHGIDEAGLEAAEAMLARCLGAVAGPL
jgi:phospholipase/carboxylesterase